MRYAHLIAADVLERDLQGNVYSGWRLLPSRSPDGGRAARSYRSRRTGGCAFRFGYRLPTVLGARQWTGCLTTELIKSVLTDASREFQCRVPVVDTFPELP